MIRQLAFVFTVTRLSKPSRYRLIIAQSLGAIDVVVGMKTRARGGTVRSDPIRDATVSAFNRVLEPLIELMLDAGVTVHEFNNLVRVLAVHGAMKRLRSEGNKQSKSRAAIMTGLPRSEVAKILKSSSSASKTKSAELPARRILAAWNDDPRFSTENGNPAVLPIFGRPVSLEHLVVRYGGGIPVRAMLDELTRMQAIERLANQRVKMRHRVPALNGLTETSIATVGERCRDLLQTLAHNRKQGSAPLFQETAASDNVDLDVASFVRAEVSQLAKKFVEKVGTVLKQVESEKNPNHPKAKLGCRLGVTTYFFQDNKESDGNNVGRVIRKNLRRQPRRDGKEPPV